MVNPRKLFIKTFGCQMNVYDSTRMADVMAPLGYECVDSPDGADLVVLNTCHIREKASEKVFSELGRLKNFKQQKAADGGRMLLAVAGCVAQAEGELILERAPQVDLVFGPQTYHRLPELVVRSLADTTGERILATEFPADSKFDFLPEKAADRGASAYLTVQEGCDKFCTFCVVPYTRGAEASRPVSSILNEAKRLVAAGTVEITLLGQNVNAYHGEGPDGHAWSLGRLLCRLAEIEGLERLRYTTSHPRDMHDALIEAHRDLAKLMPYLHLPVQSGSDRVLAAMNRRHTAEDYRRLVADLRRARPDLALSSDFIVGFPGESDEDFAATLRLITEIGYAQAYSFKYSPRPGTPGAALPDQVPETVKSERLATLQQLIAEQQLAFNQATVGQTLPVLLESPGRRDGQLVGRSPYMQSVHLEAPQEFLGTICTVAIESAHPNSLHGRMLDSSINGSGGSPDRVHRSGTMAVCEVRG